MGLLLARGRAADLAEADSLLEKIKTVHAERFDWRRLVEVYALRALWHQARGNTGQALDALAESVRLAERGQIVRVYVDEGPALAPLLRQLQQQGVAPQYLGRVLAAFPTPPVAGAEPPPLRRHDEPLVETLTDREMAVLELLAQRLSDKEVAAALVISPRTVRRHLSNIFEKLHVNKRRDAAATARSLGLI